MEKEDIMKNIAFIIYLSGLILLCSCPDIKTQRRMRSTDYLIKTYYSWNSNIQTLDSIADVSMKMGNNKARDFNAHIMSSKQGFFRMIGGTRLAGTVMDMLLTKKKVQFYNLRENIKHNWCRN